MYFNNCSKVSIPAGYLLTLRLYLLLVGWLPSINLPYREDTLSIRMLSLLLPLVPDYKTKPSVDILTRFILGSFILEVIVLVLVMACSYIEFYEFYNSHREKYLQLSLSSHQRGLLRSWSIPCLWEATHHQNSRIRTSACAFGSILRIQNGLFKGVVISFYYWKSCSLFHMFIKVTVTHLSN